MTIGQAGPKEPTPLFGAEVQIDQANRHLERLEFGISNVLPRRTANASPTPRNETSDASAWLNGFLTELRQPAVALSDRAGAGLSGSYSGSSRASAWGWLGWGLALRPFSDCGPGAVPLEDRELIDAVEVLRAELSCARTVEIRETSELTTPATIGWRRPARALARPTGETGTNRSTGRCSLMSLRTSVVAIS